MLTSPQYLGNALYKVYNMISRGCVLLYFRGKARSTQSND